MSLDSSHPRLRTRRYRLRYRRGRHRRQDHRVCGTAAGGFDRHEMSAIQLPRFSRTRCAVPPCPQVGRNRTAIPTWSLALAMTGESSFAGRHSMDCPDAGPERGTVERGGRRGAIAEPAKASMRRCRGFLGESTVRLRRSLPPRSHRAWEAFVMSEKLTCSPEIEPEGGVMMSWAAMLGRCPIC